MVQHSMFQSEDYWLQLGQLTYDFSFYAISDLVKTVIFPNKDEKNVLFRSVLTFDQNSKSYERISYNLMDVIGDIGGVYEVLI